MMDNAISPYPLPTFADEFVFVKFDLAVRKWEITFSFSLRMTSRQAHGKNESVLV